MAEIRLVVGRDPQRLLEEAAEGFLVPLQAGPAAPFPTPGYLLALRQGGLRDDLIALARERGVPGWFDPPLCVFHELPLWLGCSIRRPCGDFERAALLAHLLRGTSGTVFRHIARVEDFLDALEQLVGELAAEGVTPEELARASERVAHRDAFERARSEELVALYRRYVDQLEGAGLRDGRATLVDCARALGDDPEGLRHRLGGRREIRFFGMHDLRGGWRFLLRALQGSPALDRVILYVSEPMDFGPGLTVGLVRMEDPDTMGTRLFTQAGCGDGHFDSIQAPTVERELGEVARRIRALVDRGVPLDRIFVVARQARPYVDLIVRALRKFRIPATARRRLAYREIPVVRAVLALFAAAADGWSRPPLVELADSPYLAGRLDSRVLNFVGFRQALRGLDNWERALAALEREARAYESDKERQWRERPPPSSRRVLAARRAFREFSAQVRDLDGSRPLVEWLRWVGTFVQTDPWGIERRIYDVPAGRYDLAKRDFVGWRGLRQILEEWLAALEAWGGGTESLTVAQFHLRLQEMLAGDAALWTETFRGVRVMEALAAAYRRFDHVFLVGLEAGAFPVRAPRSPLLDENDRAALVAAGLPLDLPTDWDARERSLFQVLVAGAECLTVSYPSLSAAGREVIRSVFIEALADVATEAPAAVDQTAVLTPGLPLHHTPEAATQAVRAAEIERLRQTTRPSPYNGSIEHPALIAWLATEFGEERQWSPTQLEAYAKCPWAFFSSRLLRLEKLDDPDEEMEPTVRGRVLHDALRRFYDGAAERIGGPVFLRETDLAWAEPQVLDALDQSLEEFAKTVWMGAPVLRGAKREELRRILRGYLHWEVQLNEDMFNTRKINAPRMLRTAVWLHERRFDEAVLERDGLRLKYRGAVDRVEIGVDERVPDAKTFAAAVDYKTSKAGAPGGGDKTAWEDGVILQLPLYAHALIQLVPGLRVSRVEYRALVQQEVVHPLELHQVDKKTGLRYPNEEDRAKMEGALDWVPRLVRRVRRGEFPADPAPSCMCPPFCHGWDICRVAGGPQAKTERR